MIPKRVTLENFLSFGPKTEIKFDDDEPIWVLGGANGSGKSAVFDAMTFALFGVHRGGAKSADSLIRHGTNGFAITFEFEFNGIDYRVMRNCIGRSSMSVEQKAKDDEKWTRVPGVNSVTEIKSWTERTLGLGFEAFKTSVLLRQGEADAIIEATGSKRLEILKKIIGAERFEALSERVHDASKSWKDRYGELKTKQDLLAHEGRGKISAEQLADAAEAVKTASTARMAAQEDVLRATKCIDLAKQWAMLSERAKKLVDQVCAADARAANAEAIRSRKAELDGLTAAVPILKKYVSLRDRLVLAEQTRSQTSTQVEALAEEVERLAGSLAKSKEDAGTHRTASERHDREAKQLRSEAANDSKFVAAADEIATLQKQLGGFEKILDELLVSARDRYAAANLAAVETGNDKAEAAGLLKQAKDRQKEFAKVGVGVKCARCGQKVTAKHAEQERAEIAEEIDALNKRVRKAETSEKKANDERTDAEAERDRLDKRVQERNAIASQLTHQQKTLAGFGIEGDSAELRKMMAKKAEKALEYETAAKEDEGKFKAASDDAARFVAEHKAALAEHEKAAGRLRDCERALEADSMQKRNLLDQLAPEWHSRVDSLDGREIESLETKQLHLVGSGVEEQFKQLQQDTVLRDEWIRQRDDVNKQMELLPVEARVASADAEAKEKEARTAALVSDELWSKARDTEITLLQQRDAHNKLVDDLAKAERQFDLHKKLDDLLGKEGLQRELVRTAEEEIVRLANDTLRNLSAGDLSLELDRPDDSDDKAFTLLVQQADKPKPTEVLYLSGSEKFRVSVAIALAIGQYATGKARPLECVIIDEGFGSLDRDGLEAARAELKRLSTILRRIILVSHQEDFANEFPVIIQLKRGAEGTTATTVRR